MPISKQGGIKSVQRGVITIASTQTNASATISAVDTAKAVVKCLGQSMDVTGVNYFARGWLSSSTSIGFTRTGAASGYSSKVTYEVTEYF